VSGGDDVGVGVWQFPAGYHELPTRQKAIW
jgi:hypothetical protein